MKKKFTSNIRKSTFYNALTAFFVLLLFSFQVNVMAQCTWVSNAYGSGTAPSSGVTVTIETCSYAGEQATLNSCVAGETYSVSYSGDASAIITVFDATQTLVTSGSGTLFFTPTTAGIYYVQGNLAGCATASNCNVLTMTGYGVVTCMLPNSLASSGVTGTAATLTWVEGGTATNWAVEWGVAGFAQGTGTVVAVSTTPTLTVSTLSPGNSYDYYVSAICTGADTSSWASSSVSTLCQSVAPWNEDFNNGGNIPTCWTTSGTGSGWQFGSPGFSWNTSKCSITPSDHTGNGSGYASMDQSATDTDILMETDSIDVSALTVPQLEFYYWMCGTGYTPLNSLYVEAYNGATWDTVATITQGIGNWEEFSYNLSSYIYNTNWVKIRFRAESGGNSTTDYYGDQALDDIAIFEAPTCPKPEDLMVSSPTASGATLDWTETGSATAWDVEYGLANYTFGSAAGTVVAANSNPFVLTGLSPLTDYDVYVRSDCGANDSSFWIGPETFTTGCTGPLSGTYTMDPNSAVSATNFTSMADFAQALDICGLGGATVLNVVNNGDTLVGPWDLGSITGSSATNTLIVNGNNNLVHKNTGENHFVRLEGTHYLTIDGFNFVNQTTAAVFGIQMKDSCTNILITNNTINLGITSSSSASGGIVASNSTTNATTAGINVNFVNISNNEIIGGYYGISMYGGGMKGCVLADNSIHDFYQYGILFRNTDSNIVENNDIFRGNRSTHSSFYGIRIGVSTRTIVRGNKIHNSGATASACYALEMQGSPNTGSQESYVYNNQIYNLQSTGTTYGLYFSNATVKHMKVYNNTVLIDNSGTGTRRGIYLNTNSDSITVQNNMVVLKGIGTGTKTGFYLKTGSTPLLSDNNVIHVSGSGTKYFGYSGGNRADLAAWQTATSLDANSYESDPFFANPANHDLTPLALATDNIGLPVSPVTMDISGATRSTTSPDAGSLEFTGIPGDIEMTDAMLARVSLCYGSADTAYAQVTNVLGTSVDFSTNPLTIVWNVTGPVNTTDSLVVNTGTMATTTDSIFSIATIDMSIPGDYMLSAYIKANAVNASTANDSIFDVHTVTVESVLTVSPDSILITSPFDSAEFSVSSPLISSSTPFITERCQYAGTSTGGASPAVSWMNSDDYIEITGVPGSSLNGYTYELWYAGSKRITYTFGATEVFSPNGTAILGTYLGTSSPANFFYVVPAADDYTTGSGSASGHILKDPSGNIVDVLGYYNFSFPAAAGVTAADWSGSTVSGASSWGIRLEGPDLNGPAGWSKSSNTNRQDPNTVNANVTVPSAPTVAVISWDSAGTTVGTDPTFYGGPYNADGVHTYEVTYTNACGIFMDTVVVSVDLTKAMMTDSTHVTCNGADDGTATVTGSGGDAPYTYMWDNGDVTAMADLLTPGTHTVTVYDANMWPATATVMITEPVILAGSTSTTPSTCGVPSGSATVTATGGTSPYSYSWSDGQTTATATALIGGGYTVTVMDANMCSYTDAATVSDIGAPTISIAIDSIVACYGGSTGVVTASATGGSTPYAFAWPSGGTAATENGLAVGTYDVTLTDASGCVASKSIAMTQNTPLLAIVTGSTNPLCNGDATGTASSIAGGGVAPYAYSWSNGDMTANASSLAAGSHMLTVTDNVGCIQTTTVSIIQPNQLAGVFVNASNVSCNAGTDGSVGILNSGGTAPYSMSWSNGSTTASASGLSAGYVSVTVTDANSCMMMDSVSITEPTAVTSTATVTSNVLCNGGNTGTASVVASGGTMPLVYAWSNGSGGSIANGLAAGSYTVTISDGNNCQSTGSVTVTEPTALALTVTGTDISCNGMNDGAVVTAATGGTSPYSYSWSNGASTSTQNNLGAGTFSVDVADANGCMISDASTITEPIAVVVDLGGASNLCDGESMMLDAGAGFSTYTWTTGNSAQTETVTAANLGVGTSTIGVMVTDGNGCMGEDSVDVSVSAPVVTSIIGMDELCSYETGSLDAGPGFSSYNWSNSSSSQLINVYAIDFAAGDQVFTVTVTDANGCTGEAMDTVTIHPEVMVDLGPDTVVWKESSHIIMADSGYASYLWNTGASTQNLEVSAGGMYTLMVTDSLTGCIGEDDVQVDFVLSNGGVHTANLRLYPNPAVNYIHIDFANFSNQGVVDVELISITGQLVKTYNVDVSGNNGTSTLDVSNLATGTYMVRFEYEGQNIVKQFTIK